uniref:arylamine N-acetyltransferase n=1 Tax=Labrus bergylta TaxID=56723 RepID=A0A3Q3E250_9LABR
MSSIYFKQIGFHGSFNKPDLETLKLIHKQHVMTVPFENLSMHCRERIVMDLEATYSKIMRNNRGGWCLENNFLFGWVLREMGYDCTTLNSKCFMTPLNDYYIFCLINEGGVWVLEKTNRKPKVLNPNFAKSSLINRIETKPVHHFTLTPREPDSFLDINDKLQIDLTSVFVNKSICSLQTPTGFRALLGWTYSEVTFKPEEGVDIFDMREVKDVEVDQILTEKFNIKLPSKMTPVGNKSWYTI